MSFTNQPADPDPDARLTAEGDEDDTAGTPASSRPLPLRARNIGILCDDPQRPEAVLLHRAATELGARVALVRSDLDAASGRAALQDTARVLGRLYDAVLCVDLPPPIVQRLRDAAEIPVIADDTGAWRALAGTPSQAGDGVRALLAQLAGLCA